MNPLHRLQHAAQRGFTLIELMVVLVIIGVLAALIVPNVLDRADDARVTAAKTDIANLSQALKLYKLDNQHASPPPSKACKHW
ncbi:Type II secretion system protein G [Curvibacter sp. AEP1-3]|nr:Type II secretion system protein G [Curvibacter sp. AEP1-3]